MSYRVPFRMEPVCLQQPGRPKTFDPTRTALAAAAYVRRTKFTVEDVSVVDFTMRGEDLMACIPIVPEQAPGWVSSPFLRWHKADQASDWSGDPADVRAWHVVGYLPPGASAGEWLDGTSAIFRTHLPREVCADVALHCPSLKPAHMHAIVASRMIRKGGYGPRLPDLAACLEGELQEAWLAWVQ